MLVEHEDEKPQLHLRRFAVRGKTVSPITPCNCLRDLDLQRLRRGPCGGFLRRPADLHGAAHWLDEDSGGSAIQPV